MSDSILMKIILVIYVYIFIHIVFGFLTWIAYEIFIWRFLWRMKAQKNTAFKLKLKKAIHKNLPTIFVEGPKGFFTLFGKDGLKSFETLCAQAYAAQRHMKNKKHRGNVTPISKGKRKNKRRR